MSGKLKHQITSGNWAVLNADYWDKVRHEIYFRAGGLNPKEDPYNVHYCRVNEDGSGLIDLTPAIGTHSIEICPTGKYYFDRYSLVSLAPVVELRRLSDGSLVCVVESGDASALEATGWKCPQRFAAKGRDGKTAIYGTIYWPSSFDPAKKYHVVEDVYGAPDTPYAQTHFSVQPPLPEVPPLDSGFCVVQIDAMGTTGRSKAFMDSCWKNLGDAGIPDRIAWITAASTKFPQLDLRGGVAMVGNSYGGYVAIHALENAGDFYTAAVSSCGDHDLTLVNGFYIERWMGYPVGPWYVEQSNTTHAEEIRGNLLMIVCGMDHVVNPIQSYRMIDALERANKKFDLVLLPQADHGDCGSYGQTRESEFLRAHFDREDHKRDR